MGSLYHCTECGNGGAGRREDCRLNNCPMCGSLHDPADHLATTTQVTFTASPDPLLDIAGRDFYLDYAVVMSTFPRWRIPDRWRRVARERVYMRMLMLTGEEFFVAEVRMIMRAADECDRLWRERSLADRICYFLYHRLSWRAGLPWIRWGY